jgi:uncharacterized protein
MVVSMIQNVGRPFSVYKFYNDSKSRGLSTSKDALYDYLAYIEDAYIAFAAANFDKSFRKSQTLPKKLYAIDPGMIRAVSLDFESDFGRLFENVVFLDLKRLGCKVFYYVTSEGYEVDFVAQTTRGHKKLFQVAWDVRDKKTVEREERALKAGMKELKIPGELVTLKSYLKNGIKIGAN